MTCDRSCSQANVCGVSETAARRHDQRPAVAAPPEAQPVVQLVPPPSGGGADGAGGAAGAAAHGGVAARGSPSACLSAERPARSPAAGHRGTLLRGAHVATRWHCRRWLWLPGRLSDRVQGNRCCGHRTIACDLTDCAMRERLERQPHMLLVAADAPSLCSMSV